MLIINTKRTHSERSGGNSGKDCEEGKREREGRNGATDDNEEVSLPVCP